MTTKNNRLILTIIIVFYFYLIENRIERNSKNEQREVDNKQGNRSEGRRTEVTILYSHTPLGYMGLAMSTKLTLYWLSWRVQRSQIFLCKSLESRIFFLCCFLQKAKKYINKVYISFFVPGSSFTECFARWNHFTFNNASRSTSKIFTIITNLSKMRHYLLKRRKWFLTAYRQRYSL